jgi:hypothetical protein
VTDNECYGCDHPHGCLAPDEPCYEHCEACADEIRAWWADDEEPDEETREAEEFDRKNQQIIDAMHEAEA